MEQQQQFRRWLPAELMNEMFAILPLEIAFGLLFKMPNGLLAWNVRKRMKLIKMAMKDNKLNMSDCGSDLSISAAEEGKMVVVHSGSHGWNCIRAILPIPTINLGVPMIAFYFEVKLLKLYCYYSVGIGFCTQQYPLKSEFPEYEENSIGIWLKGGIWINKSFNQFENYGGYFDEGKVIGLGIIKRPSANSSLNNCFATYNGKLLGIAELPQEFAKLQLFPAIIMSTNGNSIHANFGKEEWCFKEFKKLLE